MSKLLEKLRAKERSNLQSQRDMAEKAAADNRDMFNEKEEAEMRQLQDERKQIRGQIVLLEQAAGDEEELNTRAVDQPTAPLTPKSVREEKEEQKNRGSKPTVQQRWGKPIFTDLNEQLECIMRAAMPEGTVDSRLTDVMQRAQATGMSEGVNADGGFLLEPTLADGLIETILFQAQLFGRVMRRPLTTGNALTIYGVDEKSRENGSIAGGIQIFPAAEADAYVKSGVKFKQLEFKLKKITGLAYTTDEESQDIPYLAARINQEFTRAFAIMLDKYIFEGDGASVCHGLIKSPSKLTQDIEAGQVDTSPLVVLNLTKMRSHALPGFRSSYVWLVSPTLEPHLPLLTIGNYPVMVPAGGIRDGYYDRILGNDVIPFEFCEEVNTEGDIVYFCPQRYLVIDRSDIASMVSIHVRFLYDEQVVKFTYRFDGKVIDTVKLKAAKGNHYFSPVITLDDRPAA